MIDHGSRDQLLANLRGIRSSAARRREYAAERLREYGESGGPFLHRLPVVALVAPFSWEQAELLCRWSEWARDEVETWTGVTPETGARVPPSALAPGGGSAPA